MTTPTQKADAVYKCLAGVGFLINHIDEMTRKLGRNPFSHRLKNVANMFYKELLAAENIVAGHKEQENKDVAMDQMAQSYELLEHLLDIQLEAGRKLSPDGQLVLLDEINAVLSKYGVKID